VVQAVAQTGGTIIPYGGLVGTAEGRRPLGRPRCEWMLLMLNGIEGMDWINLAQDLNKWWTLLNIVMNFWVL
jgi:hypothetical protein